MPEPRRRRRPRPAPATKRSVAKRSAAGDARREELDPTTPPRREQVARRADQKAARRRDDAAGGAAGGAVAVNELDPPRELLERPDMFLELPDRPEARELRHLDAVLADHGADDQPDDGGAG